MINSTTVLDLCNFDSKTGANGSIAGGAEKVDEKLNTTMNRLTWPMLKFAC